MRVEQGRARGPCRDIPNCSVPAVSKLETHALVALPKDDVENRTQGASAERGSGTMLTSPRQFVVPVVGTRGEVSDSGFSLVACLCVLPRKLTARG
jgi:hypothetical protein